MEMNFIRSFLLTSEGLQRKSAGFRILYTDLRAKFAGFLIQRQDTLRRL